MKSGTQKLSCRTSTTWRSARPSSFRGSSSRNLPKSASSNFLVGANCQSTGTEPVAEFQHAGIVKPFDGIAGLRQHAAVGRKARSLQREHKTVRHLARPFAKALRLLRAVIGAVDLDRGQLRGGVGQLLRLRELLRIKHPAPWREGPAADADIDVAGVGGSGLRGFGHGGARLEGGGDLGAETSQTNRDWPVRWNRAAVRLPASAVRARLAKKEKKMRVMMAAMLAMTSFRCDCR